MATLQQLGTVRLRLRLGGEDYQETLHAVQGDTGRVLEFDVLDSSGMVVTDLTGVTPTLFVRHPNGKEVGSATGEIVGGVIRITIPSSLLAYAGETKAQIQLVDSANQHKLHDHLYRLQIEESLEAGASPGENLWFSLAELTEAIAEVHLLVEQYDTDVAAVSTMRAEVKTNRDYVAGVYTQMSNVITSENARVTAESARKTAETARAGAETARATAWTALKNYWDQSIRPYWDNTIRPTWNSMTNTWNGWVDTWAGWTSAEGTRQDDEVIRQDQESIRQANEGNRVDAEASREAQWATWDTTMQGVISHATESAPGIVTVRKTAAETATPHRVPTIGDMSDKLGNKVDKITGKGLSENDYTTTEKNKLSGIATGANNYSLPTASAATLGGIRVGANLEIANGVLAATFALATTSANGLMSASDKSKLDGIASGANNYTHPANHPASMITQDSARRMVSDTQITAWNSKVDKSGGQMTGALVAQSSGNTRQARNIAIGTTAPTSAAGYSEGDLFLVVP